MVASACRHDDLPLMKINRREMLRVTAAAAGSLLVPQSLCAQQDQLIRKPIPSSGERLAVIGLGSARRYEEARNAEDFAALRATLQRFRALGGQVVDTAPVYGQAEPVLGTLIEDVGARDALFVATKVSIAGSAAGIKQIEQSFKNLKTSKIDLIAVHNLRDTNAHLETLRALKQAGRIRYVGITTSFDGQYREFEEVMKRETLDFIQIDYALDNRNAGARILPLAKERGMAVMINLPFGRGRLFNATKGRALPEWAAELDCATWAQFFLKYIVSHEAITCAIPGMARPEYVDDNIGAARGRLPDAAMRRRMENFIDTL
jgi:aryl-alcohol dehydrogenase-like predicted oxidoreductase